MSRADLPDRSPRATTAARATARDAPSSQHDLRHQRQCLAAQGRREPRRRGRQCQARSRAAAHDRRLVSFGHNGASPALLAACADAGIALSFLTPNGKFQARVEGPRSGNVLLRRTQYRWADDPARAVAIVRGIVAAKAANQRTVLRRALRDRGGAMEEARRAAIVVAERLAD